MINLAQAQNVALLIDADNVPGSIREILEIVDYYGHLQIARAYTDWNSLNKQSWQESYEDFRIDCIQVDNIGKNATDHAILFEIGEMMARVSSGELPIEFFILVSGDGDFASMCGSVKQRGWPVIGIGRAGSSSPDLEESCDKFYHIDKMEDEIGELKRIYPIHPRISREFFGLLCLIYQNFFKPYTWIPYDALDRKLHEVDGYKAQYGNYKLSEWLKNFTEDFEHKEDMVRSVDPTPSITRQSLLYSAYKQTKQTYDLVQLTHLGRNLHKIANEWGTDIYKTYFGSKSLSEWIAEYPDKYEVQGD